MAKSVVIDHDSYSEPSQKVSIKRSEMEQCVNKLPIEHRVHLQLWVLRQWQPRNLIGRDISPPWLPHPSYMA